VEVRVRPAEKLKHEIDFEEAQALWDDPRGVVIEAVNRQEERSMLIAERDSR
jgi:uncharacterized DUF497 family protein